MPSDVRRSARGAPLTTAVKPPPPASTTSSSSLSSGRQDRQIKLNNNPKSETPRSLSSEDTSEPPRRSQRAHQPKEVEASKDNVDADEDAGDEEEITRCICGQQDYPGPPLSEAFIEADGQPEDAGGLFISCDGCSVWQHGGCVGIIEESKVPDKYYCEECRPKLHELHIDANGQKYSLYQPVNGKSNRKASVSKHGDKAQREREALRASAEAQSSSGRRRATMRSKEHDDEEEQLRRAIEESRRAAHGTGKRGGKRVRDADSEDNKQAIKRQRTVSESIPSNTRKPSVDDESDEEATSTLQAKETKSNAARVAEAHEKENEREKIRAEAAGRRQERAGRRRADDEAAEETPRPTTSAKTSPPPSSQPESAPETNGMEKPAPKKPGPKKKKLGNNQYTNKSNDASSPHGKKRNLNGTSSGEENLANGDSHQDSATVTRKNSPDHIPSGKGKFGRAKKATNGNGAKHEDPADLTLATMKRRMDAMSAFIARAQLDLSGEKTPSQELGSASPAGAGGAVQPSTVRSMPGLTSSGKATDEMSALEFAEVVSKSIAGWHQQFGHLA